MEQFSKDTRFKNVIDGLNFFARATGKKGEFILHKLIESSSFGALKIIKFNLFYISNGNTDIVLTVQYKSMITKDNYQDNIKDTYIRFLNDLFQFTNSKEFAELI